MTKNNQMSVKKERRLKFSIPLPFALKVLIVIIVICCIIYILGNEHVVIYLNSEKRYTSLFFTIMVSMTLLLFLVGFGIKTSMEHYYIKVPILIIIIYMISVGMEYVGLGITFNTHYSLLNYIHYESNSKKGILFLSFNIYIWFVAWLIHLPFITDDKD